MERSSVPVANIVVYTGITGGKDSLRDPLVHTPGVKYVAFTDDPKAKSKIWEIRHVSKAAPGDAWRVAKQYKMLPHRYFSEYDISVWIDGSCSPVVSLHDVIKLALQRHPIAFFQHPWRKCLYEEGWACIDQGRGSRPGILKQLNAYAAAGMPKNYGLVRGGVIFRRHKNAAVKKAMRLWWEQVCTWTPRDQVSFPYVCWRLGLKYATLPSDMFEVLFDQRPHERYSEKDDRHPDKVKARQKARRRKGSIYKVKWTKNK